MDDDDEDSGSAQYSSTIRYKKRRKTESSQLKPATVVIDVIKESLTPLGSFSKEPMAGANCKY